MIAGRLKYKLKILAPVKCVSEYGSEEEIFEYVREVWAERVKFTGRRSEETSEHFPDYSAQFNIRAAHPVQENWRVQVVGGELFTVTNIIPNIDRGFKTLICERVNE